MRFIQVLPENAYFLLINHSSTISTEKAMTSFLEEWRGGMGLFPCQQLAIIVVLFIIIRGGICDEFRKSTIRS
jgi:hypothetical protein